MISIEAEGLKSAITFFNKFITNDEKAKTWVKIEDIKIQDEIYLMFSIIKNEIGFRYRILIDSSLNFRGCVYYSDLQEALKPIKKKDKISLKIEATKIVIGNNENSYSIPYTIAKKGVEYNWIINGSVLIDYWEEVMIAHKYASNRSVYDISNQLFFNLSNNQTETINTNEVLLVYNRMESEVYSPITFGINHQYINPLLKWSSISKGISINIMTFRNLVSFFDGKAEIIINRIDDTNCFKALKNLSEKTFENKGSKDISFLNDKKAISIFLDENKKPLPYVDIENVRVQKKVLDNILEVSGLNYYIPKNNLDPIVFDLDEGEVYLKLLLLPINKEKQA